MAEKNYTDRRILHTRKFLRDALIELLKEMPIGKITPTELSKRADINRNTFYSHYSSPEELLKTLENEFLAQIEKEVVDCPDAQQAVAACCRAMRKERDLCEVLFADNASPAFSSKIFSLANKRNLTKMEKEQNNLKGNWPEMLSYFTIYGGSAVMQIWVKTGMQEEPEELAAFIQTLCIQGTSALTR